jgi:hypothetical protein
MPIANVLKREGLIIRGML